MSRGDSDDPAHFGQSRRIIRSGKAIQESRQSLGVRWNMPPDQHGSGSQFPGNHAQPFARVRILSPKQFIRQASAKLTMQPNKVINTRRLNLQIFMMIDEPLNFYMRDGFPLERSFPRIV
jgi:hypothetical protein